MMDKEKFNVSTYFYSYWFYIQFLRHNFLLDIDIVAPNNIDQNKDMGTYNCNKVRNIH